MKLPDNPLSFALAPTANQPSALRTESPPVRLQNPSRDVVATFLQHDPLHSRATAFRVPGTELHLFLLQYRPDLVRPGQESCRSDPAAESTDREQDASARCTPTGSEDTLQDHLLFLDALAAAVSMRELWARSWRKSDDGPPGHFGVREGQHLRRKSAGRRRGGKCDVIDRTPIERSEITEGNHCSTQRISPLISRPFPVSSKKTHKRENLSLSRGSGYVETSHDVVVVLEIRKVVLSWDQTTYVGSQKRRPNPFQLNRRGWLEVQVDGGGGGGGGGTLAS